MRKRDVAVLVLATFLLVVILQQEGSVSLEKGFFFRQHANMYNRKDSTKAIAKPIITDIEGNNEQNLVTVGEDGHLRVVKISVSDEDTFQQLATAKTFNLNEQKTSKQLVHHRIVGLGVGYIEHRYLAENEHKPPKQKIVVVLSNWKVLCFDHDLTLQWEMTLSTSENEKHFGDPFEVVVTILPQRIHNDDKGIIIVSLRTFKTLSAKKAVVESNTHYSYFAFDGATGTLRWKHESEDFKVKSDETLFPQHNFKIELGHHYQHLGEVHWRTYKKRLMRYHLPHTFRHAHDSIITVDHFFAPTAAQARGNSGASGSERRLISSKQKQEYGDIGEKLAFTDSKKKSASLSDNDVQLPPNVLVSHTATGLEIIHLYTGRMITQISPLLQDTVYVDMNHDGVLDAVSASSCAARIESGTGVTKRGEEDIPLFLTQICKPQSSINSIAQFSLDILNSDAVSEEIDMNDPTIGNPAITVVDVIGPHKQRDAMFLVSSGLITCVSFNSKKHRFATRWQVMTPSSYDKELETESNEHFFVELVGLRLRPEEKHSFMIAVGEKSMTVLDLHGTIQQVLPLQSPIVAPVILQDINGDGVYDVLVTTKHGIYGYVTKPHTGISVLSFLVVIVVLVIGVMYLSTYIDLQDPYFVKKSEMYQK